MYGDVKVTCPEVKEQLSKKGISKNKSQGRDLINIIINAAYLYGYSKKDYIESNDKVKNFILQVMPKQLESTLEVNKSLVKEIEDLKRKYNQ